MIILWGYIVLILLLLSMRARARRKNRIERTTRMVRKKRAYTHTHTPHIKYNIGYDDIDAREI